MGHTVSAFLLLAPSPKRDDSQVHKTTALCDLGASDVRNLTPICRKDPLSWMVGSDVVVVDPPRKGLDPSLLNALRTISSAESKKKLPESHLVKAKDEKRPWILRAREASVRIPSNTTQEESQSLPQTILYISCGWESFKEDCASLLSSKEWHLEKAHGFNFFPGTRSIEVLAVFKRGPSKKLKKSKVGKKKKSS